MNMFVCDKRAHAVTSNFYLVHIFFRRLYCKYHFKKLSVPRGEVEHRSEWVTILDGVIV